MLLSKWQLLVDRQGGTVNVGSPELVDALEEDCAPLQDVVVYWSSNHLVLRPLAVGAIALPGHLVGRTYKRDMFGPV